MRYNYFVTIFLIFLLQIGWGYGQTNQSFFYPPGLELSLPGKEWIELGYYSIKPKWNGPQYRLENKSENIEIRVHCDLASRFKWPMDEVVANFETALKTSGVKYRVETINGLRAFFLEATEKDEHFPCLAIGTHPWGYFASIAIDVNTPKSKKAYAKERQILSQLRFHTPAQIDSLLGYPYPPSFNRDSLLAERRQSVMKAFESEPIQDDEIKQEIQNATAEQLIPDAFDGYSWQKCYQIKEDFETGNIPLNDALNEQFDLKRDRNMNGFLGSSESYEALKNGIRIAILRSLSPSIEPTQYGLFELLYFPYFTARDTTYWSTIHANDSLSTLLIGAKVSSGNWETGYQEIIHEKKTIETIVLDMEVSGDFDENGDWMEAPKHPPHHISILRSLESDFEHSYCAFNAGSIYSNCIPIRDLNQENPQYDVTYYVNEFPSPNGRASVEEPNFPPNVRDSTQFSSYFHKNFAAQMPLSQILADSAMMKLMEGEFCMHVYQGYDAFTAPEERQATEEEIVRKICEIRAMDLRPSQRLYCSKFLFEDLDGDGIEELFHFSVNNGQLENYFVVKETPQGVVALPKGNAIAQSIQKTTLFSAIKRISLMEQNLLARFGQ